MSGRAEDTKRDASNASRRLRRRGAPVLRLLAWLAVLAVAVLSLAPASLVPSTEIPGPTEHVAAYAVAILVFGLAYPGRTEEAAMALLALALAFEALQALSPGRTPDPGDAAGSAAGVLFGFVLAKSVSRLRRRFRSDSRER
ncbi:MAG: hypothetical protein ACQEUZ_14760 [Pseudomonadota bacterium]